MESLDLRQDPELGSAPKNTATPSDAIQRLHQFLHVGVLYQEEQDCDVFVYAGPIERRGYDLLCNKFSAHPTPRANAILILSTFGGDPHAAFRVARALSHRYPNGEIRVLVPSWCKSAGTLICIGAHELVLGDSSELGPLDVQVQKPDEMIGRISGLDILRGMESLKTGLLDSFRQFLVDINAGTGISTKSAADVATKLAVGIYEPILGQVDPMRLGEMEAALQIAYEYGARLDERFRNLKAQALLQLVHGYPSHSFVIDRKEAKTLFKRVRQPDEHESIIADAVLKLVPSARSPATTLEVVTLDEMLSTISERLPPAPAQSEGNIDESQHNESSQEEHPGSPDCPGPSSDEGLVPDAPNEHDAPGHVGDTEATTGEQPGEIRA